MTGPTLITREELKEKLDRGDDFKLVTALGDWQFRAAHIPGSISVCSPQEMSELLDLGDDIVVYCTNVEYPASKLLYRDLEEAGYQKDSTVRGRHRWLARGWLPSRR